MDSTSQRVAPAEGSSQLEAGPLRVQPAAAPQAFAASLPLLVRLRKQLDKERQSWYVLLILCGLFGMGGATFVLGSLSAVLSIPLAGVAIFLLIYFGDRAYKQHYAQALRDMIEGQMLLVLLDESFGRNLEEQRRERYRPVLRQVPLGEGLQDRINHCAHYYKHYWRASRGYLEQPVPGVSQLACLQEGLLVGLASCLSSCLLGLPLLVFAAIRLLDAWPRMLAVKAAMLDLLSGRYEPELERQYALRLAQAEGSQTRPDPQQNPRPQ